MVLCADKRDVKPFSLARALGTSAQFDDDARKFIYALYVTSPYLDEHVDLFRLDFDIPEGLSATEKDTVSLREIENTAVVAARDFLEEYLKKSKEQKVKLVAKHIAEENPALRAVPHYCPELYDELEPNSNDDAINEVLYKHKGRAEFEMKKRSQALLKTQISTIEEAEERYKALTNQLTAFQKDNLANYVCHRKLMIELLERKLEINKAEGKYNNEDIIHDIVFPRKSNTDEIGDNHNMWLIDELLAFHEYAVSDKPLDQSVTADSQERPDILSFAEVDDDKIARAVSLVEFKKPQRPRFDEDPTSQLYRYLRIIRDTKIMKLDSGRELHVDETTRYYCYAICDINKTVRTHTENDGHYAKLKGGLGYYKFNPDLHSYTAILHFDKIVADAKKRHNALFHKLGI